MNSGVPKHKKVEYSQLETGYEFPPSSSKLDCPIISEYIKAVEETSSLYQDEELVPPMAVAAYAMAALSEGMSLPMGTLHVSQGVEFMGSVSIGDSIITYARVTRKQDRGKLHLLTIDLNVFNQRQKAVLSGKASFLLPEYNDGQIL